MNDDDLEKQLAGWRPADPPPALMRRLRAAKPVPRTHWFLSLFDEELRPRTLAFAGLLAATVWIATSWQTFASNSPARTGRTHTMQRGASRMTHSPILPPENGLLDLNKTRTVVSVSGRVHGHSLELGNFADPGMKYAMLAAGLNTNPDSPFHLEAPAGPMRLDCGFTLPGNESSSASLDGFRLDVKDQF